MKLIEMNYLGGISGTEPEEPRNPPPIFNRKKTIKPLPQLHLEAKWDRREEIKFQSPLHMKRGDINNQITNHHHV